MKGSKLIELLETFDNEDWRWFRKYLQSPYFNSREDIIELFELLRKAAPEFNATYIQKEKIYKKLFPKNKYNEKTLSYLMNFLHQQAEQFIAQRAMEKDEPLLHNYLLSSLVERQLEKHYRYQYDKTQKILEKWQAKSMKYFLFDLQLTEIANDHFVRQEQRKYDVNLQYVSDKIDVYYVVNKLKFNCEMLSRMRALNTKYDLGEEEALLSIIEERNLEEIPLVKVYLELNLMRKLENAEANFENLKSLLDKNKNEIPFFDMPFIYQQAINYCIVQIGKNNKIRYYAEECLQLYLTGINEKFLLKNDFLSPWHFKNVVKLSLNLKKYDFTEEFIKENHKKLEEEFQEDALHFNLADISYRKKNYQEAQVHLLQVQYSDIYYNLGAKAMLLKIYYETDEVEALLSLISSFTVFLHRNKKISKDIRDTYLNFTNLLARIVRSTKDKIPAVVEKIKETKLVTNRNWLLQICEERK